MATACSTYVQAHQLISSSIISSRRSIHSSSSRSRSSRSKQQLQLATVTWHIWMCFCEAFARPREAFARAMASSQPATSCHLPARSQQAASKQPAAKQPAGQQPGSRRQPAGSRQHAAGSKGSSRQQQAAASNGKQEAAAKWLVCVAWSNSRMTWCNWKESAFRLRWRTIDYVNCSLSKALHHGHGPIANSFSLQIMI